MKIDGNGPLNSPLGDRKPAAKTAPAKDGKSFADAFRKASATPPAPEPAPVNVNPPATAQSPLSANPPAAAADASGHADAVKPSAEDHLEAIKFRLKTGYYNTKDVNDALTEKLTGFFDELA